MTGAITNRTLEIENAVDAFLAAHTDWETSGEETLPEDYEDAVNAMLFTVLGSGDMPQSHLRLVAAVADLQTSFEKALIADATGDTPPDEFWRAIDRLRDRRRNILTPLQPRQTESVRELRRQGVSDNQIALHIYGYAGTGPFINEFGQVDHKKLTQEAEQPGSVIPEDWVHPEERQRIDRELSEARGIIAKVATRPSSYQPEQVQPGPESIEDLLRQNVHVDQITRIKLVSLNEVLDEAERLNLAYSYSPGYTGERRRPKPMPSVTRPISRPAPDPSGDGDEASLDAKIIEMIGQNKSAHVIASTLGIDPRKVGAVRRKLQAQSAD